MTTQVTQPAAVTGSGVGIAPPRTKWQAWYRAGRPRMATASIAPVLVGSALALGSGFSVFRFLLALIGSVAIQTACNMFNEFFDHVQGLDRTRLRRGDMVVQTGILSHRALFLGGAVTMGVGVACGLVLVALTGPSLLVIGVLSVLAALFYTAKPIALGYRALGEVTVFIFMGPIIVMGADFVHREAWTWESFWVSIPVGMLVTAILHLNNVRDMADDKANGKRTLANLLGRKAAGYEYLLLVPGAFVVTLVLIAAQVLTPLALVTLVMAPQAVHLFQRLGLETGVLRFDLLMMGTAKVHSRYSFLLAAAIAAQAAWDRWA